MKKRVYYNINNTVPLVHPGNTACSIANPQATTQFITRIVYHIPCAALFHTWYKVSSNAPTTSALIPHPLRSFVFTPWYKVITKASKTSALPKSRTSGQQACSRLQAVGSKVARRQDPTRRQIQPNTPDLNHVGGSRSAGAVARFRIAFWRRFATKKCAVERLDSIDSTTDQQPLGRCMLTRPVPQLGRVQLLHAPAAWGVWGAKPLCNYSWSSPLFLQHTPKSTPPRSGILK